MGTDNNQTARKPRVAGKAVESAPNPFKAKHVGRDPGRLEGVPGFLGSIEALCASGRAIMFARTRDGGAWAIQVLDGDQRFKEYASDQAELNDLFANLIECYGSDA